MKIKALVDRFGSNRLNASEPGKLLHGCTCIAIPFAGGHGFLDSQMGPTMDAIEWYKSQTGA